MKRILLLSVIAGCVCGYLPGTAQADDITDLLRTPVQAVNPYIPLIDVSTAVPTTRDILAVPVPTRRNIGRYPISVLRYGLNVYPSARVARRNGFSFLNF